MELLNARRVAVLCLFAVSAITSAVAGDDSVHWPSFRGTNGSGLAEGYAIPAMWNGETGDNILWKTAIQGLGHSCPVVWGDRVFVTTAISGSDQPLRTPHVTFKRDDAGVLHVWVELITIDVSAAD